MIKDFFIELIATFFYVGYVPVFPGTLASLVAAGLWFLLPPMPVTYQIVGLLFLGLVGVWVAAHVERKFQLKDPSCIVIDEVIGMGVALVGIPQDIRLYCLAFIFFRIFDISKIPPVNFVEKKLHGGWGVVGDDIIAGLMARGSFALLISCLTF